MTSFFLSIPELSLHLQTHVPPLCLPLQRWQSHALWSLPIKFWLGSVQAGEQRNGEEGAGYSLPLFIASHSPFGWPLLYSSLRFWQVLLLLLPFLAWVGENTLLLLFLWDCLTVWTSGERVAKISLKHFSLTSQGWMGLSGEPTENDAQGPSLGGC